jgi:hypothetical protein
MAALRSDIVASGGLPFLFQLQFNFDPNSLQSANAEPLVALRALNSKPRIVINAVDTLTAPADAPAVVKAVSAPPEVGGTRNLDSFIPADQDTKIKIIAGGAAFRQRRRCGTAHGGEGPAGHRQRRRRSRRRRFPV